MGGNLLKVKVSKLAIYLTFAKVKVSQSEVYFIFI